MRITHRQCYSLSPKMNSLYRVCFSIEYHWVWGYGPHKRQRALISGSNTGIHHPGLIPCNRPRPCVESCLFSGICSEGVGWMGLL